MNTEEFCDSLFKFLHLVEKAFKQKPLIYTGANFYDNYLLGKLDSYKLMIAQYTKRIPVLRDGRDFEMWQYTAMLTKAVSWGATSSEKSDSDIDSTWNPELGTL